MRQTFMDFLIDKYGLEENKPENFYIWYSNKSISKISEYAKQWSSQQTEDEVYEALAELEKCCFIAFDEDATYLDGSRYSSKSIDFMNAINKAKAILARKGNKDGE